VALYTVLLVVSSLLFVPFGLAGRFYPLAATVLGAVFLALAFRGLRAGARFDTHRWAKRVFAFSVLYLPAVLVALLVARA
jgi:protoheme IX farnesyltransferase